MRKNRVALGKVNAICVYTAWALFILLAILFLLGISDLVPVKNETLGFTLKILVVSVVLHIVFAYFVRCPYCNKCLTIQGFAPIHEQSEKRFGFDGWAVVVIRWFTGKVTCIYCGKEVNTNAL